MNRWLFVPAGCCLLAYAALFAAIHSRANGETVAGPVRSEADLRGGETAPFLSASLAPLAAAGEDSTLLSVDEAEQLLTKLSGEFMQPWRQWEASPHRLYSRAAPRPIPSISAKIQLVERESNQRDGVLLATITVRTGEHSQSIPCAVDRITKRARLFSNGEWLTAKEWLMTAPSP